MDDPAFGWVPNAAARGGHRPFLYDLRPFGFKNRARRSSRDERRRTNVRRSETGRRQRSYMNEGERALAAGEEYEYSNLIPILNGIGQLLRKRTLGVDQNLYITM